MPGRPDRASPFLPSLPTFFIILLISRYCFTTRLTSWTSVPEPAAMRRLRDPFSSLMLLNSVDRLMRLIRSERRAGRLMNLHVLDEYEKVLRSLRRRRR